MRAGDLPKGSHCRGRVALAQNHFSIIWLSRLALSFTWPYTTPTEKDCADEPIE